MPSCILPDHTDEGVKYRNVCVKCGKTYTSLGNLNRHCKFECQKGRKFICIMCRKNYCRKHHLERHLMIKHELNIKDIYNQQLIQEF